MEDMFVLSIQQYHIQSIPLCGGLDLLFSRYMRDGCHAYFHILSRARCTIFVFQVFSLTKFVMPNNGSCPRLQPQIDRYLDRLQVPYFVPRQIQYLSLQCLKVCISVYVCLFNRPHSSQPCQLKAFNILASLKERGETWEQYQPKAYQKIHTLLSSHTKRFIVCTRQDFYIFII